MGRFRTLTQRIGHTHQSKATADRCSSMKRSVGIVGKPGFEISTRSEYISIITEARTWIFLLMRSSLLQEYFSDLIDGNDGNDGTNGSDEIGMSHRLTGGIGCVDRWRHCSSFLIPMSPITTMAFLFSDVDSSLAVIIAVI